MYGLVWRQFSDDFGTEISKSSSKTKKHSKLCLSIEREHSQMHYFLRFSKCSQNNQKTPKVLKKKNNKKKLQNKFKLSSYINFFSNCTHISDFSFVGTIANIADGEGQSFCCYKRTRRYGPRAYFWCSVVTLVTFSCNLSNFEKNPKNLKISKKNIQTK